MFILNKFSGNLVPFSCSNPFSASDTEPHLPPCFEPFPRRATSPSLPQSALIKTHTGIHIRLYPNNINDQGSSTSGMTESEIPEAWMPTVKKHNGRRMALQRTAERTASSQNNEDRVPPITADHLDINGDG